MSKLKKAVVAIYIHPDYYPPTINAINCLADEYEEVVVVTNNSSHDDFFIGNNVRFIKVGKFFSPIDYEKTSMPYKIWVFIKFTWVFFFQAISSKTSLILMYDGIPLFSFFTFRHFISKSKKTWYHNHDMPMIKGTRKFSVGWFSAKYEQAALQKMNIFSLPTNDRLRYYPQINKQTKYFELPNFPSKKIYNDGETKSNELENEIKIIYQGTIGEAHGIEEVVALLNTTIQGKTLSLTLKGKVRQDYKNKINELAKTNGVEDKLHWIGIGAYKDVQQITKTQHIGIGIHIGDAKKSKPQGTASNKIYEYAACGLPVLVYDNEQFKKHLHQYSWAVFTDVSIQSMKNAITFCVENFNQLSIQAKKDFNANFYFEQAFDNAIKYLKK